MVLIAVHQYMMYCNMPDSADYHISESKFAKKVHTWCYSIHKWRHFLYVKTFLLAKAKGLNIVLQRSQGYFAHLPRPDKSCSFIWIACRTSFTTTLRDLELHILMFICLSLLQPPWLFQAILKLPQWQATPGMLLEHDCRKQPQSINAGNLWLVSGTERNSDLLRIWIKLTLPLHKYHMLWSIQLMELSTLSTNHAPAKRSV